MPASIPAFDEEARLTSGTLFVAGDLVIPAGATADAAQISAMVVQNGTVARGQGTPDGDRWSGSVDGSNLSEGAASATGTLVVPSDDGIGTWTFTWTVPITIRADSSDGTRTGPGLDALLTELLTRVLGEPTVGTPSPLRKPLTARKSAYRKPSTS